MARTNRIPKLRKHSTGQGFRSFRFAPDGDGTKVSWTFSGTALTLGAKIMAPIFNVLMKGTMIKCMRRDLEALRDVCERGG